MLIRTEVKCFITPAEERVYVRSGSNDRDPDAGLCHDDLHRHHPGKAGHHGGAACFSAKTGNDHRRKVILYILLALSIR